MKRIVLLSLSLMLTLFFMAGCGASNNGSSSQPSIVSNSSNTMSTSHENTLPAKWNVKLPEKINDGDEHAVFKQFSIVESPRLGYLLVMDFDYTNDSPEGQSFFNFGIAGHWKAYQGGIELSQDIGTTSEKGIYDIGNSTLKVKDGATLNVEIVWILRNTSDEIELEFGFKNPTKASIVIDK